MPLRNLFYRCPLCGGDPTEGRGDEVACNSCSTRFRRGGKGGRVRVHAGGGVREVPVTELVDALEAHGGPITAATGGDGVLRYRARATFQRGLPEGEVRWARELIGYVEGWGPPVDGDLALDGDILTFSGEEGTTERWPLLELAALQTASSAVQLSLPGGRLYQLRFPHDSPRRWEGLLRVAVRDAWLEAGRGEVREYQPRIVAR